MQRSRYCVIISAAVIIMLVLIAHVFSLKKPDTDRFRVCFGVSLYSNPTCNSSTQVVNDFVEAKLTEDDHFHQFSADTAMTYRVISLTDSTASLQLSCPLHNTAHCIDDDARCLTSSSTNDVLHFYKVCR